MRINRKNRKRLFRIARWMRGLSRILHRSADKLEQLIESAREDTGSLVDRTIGRTQQVTRKIELKNFIKLLTFLTVILTFVTMFVSANNMSSVIFFDDKVDVSIIILSFLLLIANVFYFAWQTLLVFQYKPVPGASDGRLPTCAVIVPAYNEGRQVALSLQSVLKSDYPPDKLEIITVNDGSRDDTWEWMEKIANEANGRIKAVNLSKNGGKRNAIYQGLQVSKADIFVTIDSDSEVLPDTVRKLVSPFIDHPKTGGVAGNIRVLNLDDGIIPRMLDVSFVFSFEFIRSAQSIIRSVMCTPGALSAYRRSCVDPFLEEWLHQTFMGRPANIGEDRAITNIILREGYDVVFQRDAIAFTEVPYEYKPLCKMFIRWARSNVRENLSMSEFVFKKFDLENEELLGTQINLVMQTIWMFTPILFLASTLYCLAVDAWTFLYSVLTVIVIWSTFPAFIYAGRYDKNESLWSYVYGVFNFVALSWIGPYSLLTVHKSGWLTRDKTPEQIEEKKKLENGISDSAIGKSEFPEEIEKKSTENS